MNPRFASLVALSVVLAWSPLHAESAQTPEQKLAALGLTLPAAGAPVAMRGPLSGHRSG